LREAEEKYRTLVEQANDAILILQQQQTVYCNPAGVRLLGYDLAQKPQRHFLDFIVPEDRLRVVEDCHLRLHHGTAPEQYEIGLRTADGQQLSMEVRPCLIQYQGQPAIMMVMHDITQRKRVQDALCAAKEAAEQANRAKSHFLANMSHELRTPLNAIIGYSEMLIEDAEDQEQGNMVSDLKKIHTAGKNLLSLINDILDLAKIEAGKMDVRLETFEVAGLIEEVVATIQPMVAKNANTFELAVTNQAGTMHTDRTKVRQSLLNLLSNACKFTERGTVQLQVTRDTVEGQAWLTFYIRDTGVGMTPEQMAILFKDFVQVDTSTTRKYSGTGLGLAITRRFCRMLGGDVTVESALGQGSTFTLRLPEQPGQQLDPCTAVPESYRPAEPVSAAGDDQRPLILVIDDDPTMHDLLSRFLTRQGFAVVSACQGQEGLQRASEVHPMAIILDVLLPDIDGWTVLATLKANPALAHIPVLMLTIVDDQRRGYALGATAYLTKPFDPSNLVQILHQHTPETQPLPVLLLENDAALRALLQETVVP
jgi:PAS domain S-box-containing protein